MQNVCTKLPKKAPILNLLLSKKVGGNGPILTEALIALGYAPTIIGAMGYPTIEPIFEQLSHKCSALFSLTSSGHTDALEFQDGKILLGKVAPIFEIDEKSLLERIPLPQLIALIDNQDVIASVNWTMVLGTTEIWKMLVRHVLPHVSKKKRILFVDLADPEKRAASDLIEALSTLKAMKKWYTVILGLNEKEGERIYNLLTDKSSDDIEENSLLIEMARAIQSVSTLDKVVIHSIKQAAIATDGETSFVEGPYCPNPFLSTGGGDNFNAGLLIGISQGFTMEESLLLAVATSGFYVRAGRSPNTHELSLFLRQWDRDSLDTKNSP